MIKKFMGIGLFCALSAALATEPAKKVAVAAGASTAAAAGDPAKGKAEFQQCASCHDGGLAGPVLKGLFQRKKLADKKTPVSVENVRKRIIGGGEGMPPFVSLKPKQVDDLIAYLQTL